MQVNPAEKRIKEIAEAFEAFDKDFKGEIKRDDLGFGVVVCRPAVQIFGP